MDEERMLAKYRHASPHAVATTEIYEILVNRFLRWCRETGRDALHVEDIDFLQYFDERLREGLALTSLDPVRSALKSFYGWLETSGAIASNPVPARGFEQPPRALPATLSVEQLRAMWGCAPSNEHRVLVGLLGICGLTPEEVINIDVPDCRLQSPTPVIRLEVQRRRGRSSMLPLDPALRDAVLECIGSRTRGPLLRRKSGQRLDRQGALRWVRATGRLAGIDPPPSARDLSSCLRALAVEHGFSYLSTVRAVGELNPSHSRRWWEHAANDPDQHAATRLAHMVFNDPRTAEGAIEEAFRSHFESHLPDAFSVMAAASALERHLREVAAQRGVVSRRPPNEMTLSRWADLLRGQRVITGPDQAAVKAVADHRKWAAHGWYERITPEIALRVLAECRRLVRSLAVEADS